jgi:hypothetical protein
MNAYSENLIKMSKEQDRIEKEETPCVCAFCCVNSALRATCKCAKIVHEINHRHEPLLIKCKSCSYGMPGCETCQQKIRLYSIEIDIMKSKKNTLTNYDQEIKTWCLECKMNPLIDIDGDTIFDNIPKCIECNTIFNNGNRRISKNEQKKRLIKCMICTHYYAVCGFNPCVNLHKTVCNLCYRRYPLESLKQDAVYHDKKYEIENERNKHNHDFGLDQHTTNSSFSTSTSTSFTTTLMNEYLNEEIKKLCNDVCKLQEQMRYLIQIHENNNDSKKRKTESTAEVEKK